MSSKFGRSILVATVAFIACACLAGVGQAQQWPAQNPPVENALPQYRSPATLPMSGNNASGSNTGGLPLDFFEPNQANATATYGVTPSQDRASVPSPTRSGHPATTKPSTQPGNAQVFKPLDGPANRIPSPPASIKTKSTSKKQSKAKPKTKKANHPVLDESIYRDRSRYPIDVRKPCWQCGQGEDCQACLIGNKGHPYQEKVYGGCQCDSRKPCKHPNFSVHWPRPFSAKLDDRHPDRAAQRYDACPDKRIVDIFDPLSTFKLSDYKRQDNGYCGPGSDPYGCLGESKLQ